MIFVQNRIGLDYPVKGLPDTCEDVGLSMPLV